MAKTRITIPVFIPHQGCPRRCVFCNQYVQTGAPPAPADIIEKARAYRAQAAPSVRHIELAFFGGSFTAIDSALQNSYLDAGQRLIDEGTVHALRVSTRPDAVSPAALERLRRAGVRTVEIGAQSFSDTVLEAAGRGHSAQDSRRAASLIREHGLDAVIQLLPGLPLDTPALARDAAREAVALSPAAVRIYPAVVLDGTELAERFRAGAYVPPSLEDSIELCADLYRIFAHEDIPVIRMGMHPMEAVSESRILGGAYHPAFGYLVKSRVRRDELEALLRTAAPQHTVTIGIPALCREEYLGPKRGNIRFLETRFALRVNTEFIRSDVPLLL